MNIVFSVKRKKNTKNNKNLYNKKVFGSILLPNDSFDMKCLGKRRDRKVKELLGKGYL